MLDLILGLVLTDERGKPRGSLSKPPLELNLSQNRIMPRRLRHYLGVQISLCKRDATGSAQRRLGQQHLEDVTVEFTTATKGVSRMGWG